MKTKTSSNQDFILASYSFDAKGESASIENSEESAKKLNSKKLSWVHIDGNNKDAKEWLAQSVKYLDYLIVDELFSAETRPRIVEFEDGILLNLRTVNSTNLTRNSEVTSIRLWVDENRIISVQKKGFKPAINLMNDIEAGKKIRNSGEFLYNLISESMELSNSNILSLDAKLDDIDDAIASNKCSEEIRDSLATVRKQAVVFRRYMVAQKEVFLHLQSSDYKWFDDWAIRHFQENYNKLCRIIDELDEIKEQAAITNQELINSTAERLNKSAFKISLIASIFLPLGFIASLLGMNVGGIPLSSHGSGFYIISYFMIVIFGSLYLVLRNKNNL